MGSLLRYWNCSPPIESRMMTPPTPGPADTDRFTSTEISDQVIRLDPDRR